MLPASSRESLAARLAGGGEDCPRPEDRAVSGFRRREAGATLGRPPGRKNRRPGRHARAGPVKAQIQGAELRPPRPAPNAETEQQGARETGVGGRLWDGSDVNRQLIKLQACPSISAR